MTLKSKLINISDHMSIRIFCGPQTIYQGKRSDVSLDENLRKYLDCEVYNTLIHNGVILLAI